MSDTRTAGASAPTDTRAAEALSNFIGGRWVPSAARQFVDVHNPALGTVIARTPLSNAADPNSPAYDLSPEPYDRRRVVGEPRPGRRLE